MFLNITKQIKRTCTGCKSKTFYCQQLLLRPWDLLKIVVIEICWPVAGRILLYDPKTPFTSRVQVGNRISAPMSYLTFGNQIYVCIYIYIYIYIYIHIYIYIYSVVASVVQKFLDFFKNHVVLQTFLKSHTTSDMRRMQFQAFPFSKVAPTALGPS